MSVAPSPAARSRARLLQAAGLVALGYLLAFGPGALTSLTCLVSGPEAVTTAPAEEQRTAVLLVDLYLVFMATLVTGLAMDRLRPWGVSWSTWLGARWHGTGGIEGFLASFVAVFTASIAGAAIVWLVPPLQGGGVPSGHETGSVVYKLVVAVFVAGWAEELLVLAGPCLLLLCLRDRLGRHGFVVALIGLVAIRMVFHLYQGPSTIQHLPWALAMIWAFFRYGQTWSLIVAHAAYDLLLWAELFTSVIEWLTVAAFPLVAWLLARRPKATGVQGDTECR